MPEKTAGEIEKVLDSIEGAGESVVVSVPEPDFGKRVVAAVKPGGAPPTADHPISRLKGQLAGYRVPKYIHFVDELPLASWAIHG